MYFWSLPPHGQHTSQRHIQHVTSAAGYLIRTMRKGCKPGLTAWRRSRAALEVAFFTPPPLLSWTTQRWSFRFQMLGRPAAWPHHSLAEAKKTLTAMRQKGDDKAADALEARIILGRAALSVRCTKDGGELCRGMQQLIKAGYQLPLCVWLEHMKIQACECMSSEQFEMLIDIIRPWHYPTEDKLPLDINKPQAVAILTHIAETADEKASVARAIADSFFSNQFSRMLKSVDCAPVEKLCGLILKSFERLEDTEILADMAEEVISPFEDILLVCRALLSLVSATPSATGYDSVKRLCAPESQPNLNENCRTVSSALFTSSYWSRLVDDYWTQAPMDQALAAGYRELVMKLGERPVPNETFEDSAKLLPEWKKQLRSGGTRELEGALVSALRATATPLLVTDLEAISDSQASLKNIASSAKLLLQIYDLISDDLVTAKDKGIVRDLNELWTSTSKSGTERRLIELAERWTNLADIPKIVDELKSARNLTLPETVCSALSKLRGKLYKAATKVIKGELDTLVSDFKKNVTSALTEIQDVPGVRELNDQERPEYNLDYTTFTTIVESSLNAKDKITEFKGLLDSGDSPPLEMMPLLRDMANMRQFIDGQQKAFQLVETAADSKSVNDIIAALAVELELVNEQEVDMRSKCKTHLEQD